MSKPFGNFLLFAITTVVIISLFQNIFDLDFV